ncbi:MAG: site-specific DNA-methyltransferase [Alphaproteobacteria bacterium]
MIKKQDVLNTIINDDCIKVLNQMEENSVDLIFADPPYNLQLGEALTRPDNTNVSGVFDNWDSFNDDEAYEEYTKQWLTAARRVLKDDGAIWVIGSYHNIFKVGYWLQKLGFWVLNDVIWNKSNPMPNFKGTRFTNAHETLIWASKNPKSKYCFNYEAMKTLNEDVQMRSDWTLPICTGKERLKDGEGHKLHSTQKPESLLYRVIVSSTKVGDVVLDPFFGTGTTGAVAKKLKRNFIGIEKEKAYIKAAQDRINAITPVDNELCLEYQSKKTQPRIAFGLVLERGMLKPGDKLYDAKGRELATLKADAMLLSEKGNGSIHQVGAMSQGLSACNGWVYWHYKDENNNFVCIDELRQQLRKEMYGN